MGGKAMMEKARDIDSKFAVSTDGKIYKKSNGEIVPNDEPLFLLRGREFTRFLKEHRERMKMPSITEGK
jgi:hypothetical protein